MPLSSLAAFVNLAGNYLKMARLRKPKIRVSAGKKMGVYLRSHRFVRGNWRNEGLSSPMILAKFCHDLDILTWNLASPVKRLSSVGSLIHYRPESVGPEIPLRCTDGCPIEPNCAFSAIGTYLEMRPFPQYLAAAKEGK